MAAVEEKTETQFNAANLLSDEEILARGVDTADVAAYRIQKYNESYSISAWINIPQLKQHTFDTDIIQLSVEEAASLMALCRYNLCSKKSEYESKQEYYDTQINNIKQKINDSLSSNTWKSGFFCKLNSRSPKDYFIYQGNDPEIKQKFWNEMDSRLIQQENIEMKVANDEKQNVEKFRHKLSANNAILAYYKTTTELLRMKSADEVIDIFTQSFRILEDLSAAFRCGQDNVDIKVILREFKANIGDLQIGEFRAFVHKKQINAITQYFSMIYFEEFQDEEYRKKVLDDIVGFYEKKIKDYIELDSFVMDFLYDDGRVYIIELNPFYAQTGAGLFSWKKDRDLFMNGPLEFRVRTKMDDKIETYFAPKWKKSLDEYKQSGVVEEGDDNKKHCIVL